MRFIGCLEVKSMCGMYLYKDMVFNVFPYILVSELLLKCQRNDWHNVVDRN